MSDYIDRMTAESEKKALNMGWTKIEEEQPKDWDKVLFGCFGKERNTGFVQIGYYRHDCYPGWWSQNDDDEQVFGVTHWMKLPAKI